MAKRQESICANLEQAQERAKEIEQNLIAAQQEFQNASKEVIEIGAMADESIQKQEKQYQKNLTNDLERLEETTATTINYQQQKVQKQIAQRILKSAIKTVDQKFQKGLNPKIQKSVNKLSISSFEDLNFTRLRKNLDDNVNGQNRRNK